MHYYQINHLRLLLLFLGSTIFVPQANSQIHLSNLFSDHMVLQRNEPITFWGTAGRKEKVILRFTGEEYWTRANNSGEWQITLQPQKGGGPYDFEFVGSQNSVGLQDVLFGDVWICSGQSNMQWQVHQTPYQESDSSFFEEENLRLLQVNVNTDYLPKDSLHGEKWQIATIENIPYFTAVGYHFGKFIQERINVPIGLVSSNLGATSIEAWMSNDALSQFEQFESEIKSIIQRNKDFNQLRQDFKKVKQAWQKAYYLKGPGMDEGWYKPETDLTDWMRMQEPGFWDDVPELNLANHDGAVWLRKTFDLPEGFDQDSLFLGLTQIDDYDITWVNGVKVGETYGRHNFRNYMVPASILKPKDNVLVVRAFDIEGKGGFSTNAFWMNGMIRGEWLIKKGLEIDAATFPKVAMPNVSPFSSPGVLYNENIAPFTQLPIKGVIWYQGESNASRAQEYSELFPALIKDWRGKWDHEFPFLYVHLANYMGEAKEPRESAWAELREAQNAALDLPKVDMAVAIDIGEADDIHPRNKLDVGHRLGQAALKHAYGEDILLSPRYKDVAFDNGKAIINLEFAAGLHSTDKHGYIRGFAIAGSDRKFHWAKAELDGNQVVVYNKSVSNPVAVRYAWSDNPGPLDLYNKASLPCSPFRTDDWPLSTKGMKYDSEATRF